MSEGQQHFHLAAVPFHAINSHEMKKSKDAKKGKRYSDKEKAEILAFVDKVNSEKKRGGQSEASKKFGLSQLTISNWLKERGTPSKAATKVGGNLTSKLNEMLKLAKVIEKTESELSALKEQFRALKASL